MINQQITAFHVDFSTLDIEKGQKAILPSGINYTIQPTTIPPTVKVEGLVLEKEQQIQPEEEFLNVE